MNGNANLCRAIVRAGARLGVNNNQGVNIFNYQVATKQLLFRLLGKYCLLQLGSDLAEFEMAWWKEEL